MWIGRRLPATGSEALPEGRYLLFNPRRDKGLSREMSDFEHQVNWELEHLEKADLIISEHSGESKSPITLLEMGLFMRSESCG